MKTKKAMENNANSTIAVLFFIRRSKLLKDGTASVCMRVTVDGHRVEVMLRRSVNPNRWSQTKECATGTDATSKELNHFIEISRAKVFKIYRQMELEEVRITAREIAARFSGRGEAAYGKTLVEVYAEHNKQVHSLVGIDYAQVTADKFDTSLLRLKEYLKAQYRADDIQLSNVDGVFVRQFDLFLKTQCGCHHNSAIKHLKNLKKVIRIALANDWMRKDPFVGIQFREQETNVEFLTRQELDRLIAAEFKVSQHVQVRDIFVFCCYTGLAFADIKTLRPEHLVQDANGSLWIRKRRQKTGVMCNIPLIAPALALIDRYKDHPTCQINGVVLPVFSNICMNDYLRDIARLCGITKPLTCHMARHTCATVVLLANKMSLENVAKILGHKNVKMTQRYAKVLDISIMNDMAAVAEAFR